MIKLVSDRKQSIVRQGKESRQNATEFDRAYTGHEMLDAFGLINMNGRVYDPALARFLSPDPFIQNPNSAQSYNRYSYCSNNPLKYTDPSGYRMSAYNESAWALDQWCSRVFDVRNMLSVAGGGGNFGMNHGSDLGGHGDYYQYSSNGYFYKNGTKTTFNNVYNNYIVQNSITYIGKTAENFIDVLNNLGQFSLSTSGNHVIVEYDNIYSDLIASNDNNTGVPYGSGLHTGLQTFQGTLSSATASEDKVVGNNAIGGGGTFSGGYYRGYINLDYLYSIEQGAMAGYQLDVYAGYYSASEVLVGNIEAQVNDQLIWLPLTPGLSQFNPDENGYREIGNATLTLDANTFSLDVLIQISIVLNSGGTFNLRTYDPIHFRF